MRYHRRENPRSSLPAKKVFRHVGFCPSCGNTAPQRVVQSHRYGTTWTWYGEDDRGHRGGPDLLAFFCVCETCDAPLLYDGIDPFEDDSDWPPLVYPKLVEFGT